MHPTLKTYSDHDWQSGLSGFSFNNCQRNLNLLEAGFQPPQPFKTGTTVVGIEFGSGVMIGADTQATINTTVGSHSAEKIYRLSNNIYCCGAGTAADIAQMAHLAEAQLEMQRLNTARRVPVACANRLIKKELYRFSGVLSCSFVIGGVDKGGSQLYCTRFDGSSDKVPYTSLGSGVFAAMGVLESRWELNMDEDAARDLVCDAVGAGISNDLYSGSSVHLTIIRFDGSVELCKDKAYQSQGIRQYPIDIKPGTTRIKGIKVFQYEVVAQKEQRYKKKERKVAKPRARARAANRHTNNRRVIRKRKSNKDDGPPAKRSRHH